jgi:hypothetical protein
VAEPEPEPTKTAVDEHIQASTHNEDTEKGSEGLDISKDQEITKEPPAIRVPITLAAIAYIGALLFKADWNLEYALFMYPRVPSMAIDALGGAFPLFLGLIHVGISQFFVSKRNSYSRRRIMIGWSWVSIAVLFVAFVQFLRGV